MLGGQADRGVLDEHVIDRHGQRRIDALDADPDAHAGDVGTHTANANLYEVGVNADANALTIANLETALQNMASESIVYRIRNGKLWVTENKRMPAIWVDDVLSTSGFTIERSVNSITIYNDTDQAIDCEVLIQFFT